MKRKGLVTAGLVAGLSVLSSMSAFAGEWKTDEVGRWYQNDDGSYTTNNWQKIKDDDGVIYDWGDHDVNPYPGAMVTGHYKTWPDWFYFNDGVRSDIPEGAMIKDCTITLENGRTATYDAEGFWTGE